MIDYKKYEKNLKGNGDFVILELKDLKKITGVIIKKLPDNKILFDSQDEDTHLKRRSLQDYQPINPIKIPIEAIAEVTLLRKAGELFTKGEIAIANARAKGLM